MATWQLSEPSVGIRRSIDALSVISAQEVQESGLSAYWSVVQSKELKGFDLS
jgi:hypothetical protein